MNQQNPLQYDLLSRALHWITAIAVAAAFVLGPEEFGQLMRQGVDPGLSSAIVWHESLGVFVFVLTIVRLVWVAFRPAAPTFKLSPWMHAAAKLTSIVLWLLLLALPVTAVLTLGSESYPLTMLGNFRVDHMPVIANSSLAALTDWGDVHGFLGDAILFVAGLHAAAAIYHHVGLKDGVLASMLFKRKSS
jgi:cytochrome b561